MAKAKKPVGRTTEEFKENLFKKAEGFQERLEEEGGYWHG